MLGTITITVGQREPVNVIVKEELAENMEAVPPESTDKDVVEDGQKDIQDANEQLPSEEEKVEDLEQPSESHSNDVGFKKVFKFVGFKFTVKKDKTEKSEPVQLLTVKKEEADVSANGAGDHKEGKLETVEEATQSDVTHPAEKIEEEMKSEESKDDSPPEEVAESPSEEAEGDKEAEGKKEPSKSPESPTNALVNDTASPLRKFFTQGWAGFRKKTSFRKPKEDEQQTAEKGKQEQEKDTAEISVEASEKEKTEKEEQEREVAEIPVEASEKEKTEKEEQEQEREVAEIPVEASLKEEVVVPSEGPLPQKTTEGVNKESEVASEEKIDLSPEEKSKPVKECKISLEEKTEIYFEEKSELAAPVTMEKSKEESESAPMAREKTEKSEPIAPLATEIFDEKLETEVEVHVSTREEKEVKTNEREQMPSSASEQSVEGDAELQRIQLTDEQLKAKETVCIVVDDYIKQIESSHEDPAAYKSPEDITSEVQLLSSQERAKVQGSPLKKLFTGTGLKKLSGKKHKGKREETKPGEQAEQIQHLADSPESPEEQKAESSASSPEESTEHPSVEKVLDATQVTETEEGAISDVERKRESVTPWASFKKMVTPKKRIRRPSESDKEEEIDKAKSATLSSTESAVSENQEETKENGEEQKLEKSTEEPKRKVDSSVSWEALICVGSSKKRARKSSSSDEEVGQRLAQEGQKIDEAGQSKETAPEMILTSSQESDQGQGNSSPEQAGSPSEGEGVSTWESFKRLVTPRRKSKTKMEERTEESVLVSSIEHSTSDGEPGKEETWVSFKKLIPGRRKKKSDGKPEQACVEEAGEEMTETNEDDSDVPAVVPLSEYEAAEQEKIEAQKATKAEAIREDALDEKRAEKLEDTLIIEQSNEGLVHAVTVTVVEGERAVTSIEERSPSWISATVTESVEQEKDDEDKQTEQIFETEVVVEETVVVTKTLPELRKDISDDTIVSELELTSEALTALEEATEVSCVEEETEVSLAEETTEMVSAVSQLTESPDTTEEVTPVQETEGTEQNLEELNKQTQESPEVAERVRLSDEVQMISERTVTEVIIQSVQKIGSEMKDEANEVKVICQETVFVEQPLNKEEADIQHMESAGSVQGRNEADESALREVSEVGEKCGVMKEHTEETKSLDISADESQWKEAEQAFVEGHEKTSEVERIGEKCKLKEEEFYSSVTITTTADPEVTAEYVTVVKQQDMSAEEAKLNLIERTPGEIPAEGAPEVDDSVSEIHEAKLELSQEFKQPVDIVPTLESKCIKVTVTEAEAPLQSDVTEAPVQREVEDATAAEPPIRSEGTDIQVQNEVEYTTEALEPRCTEALVDEAPVQSEVTEAPVKKEVENAVLTLDSKCTEAVATEAPVQSDVTEASVQREVQEAMLTLESKSTEVTVQHEVTQATLRSEAEGIASEAPMQSDVTEASVQSGVEDAVNTLEKKSTEAIATKAPMQSEVQGAVLILESKFTETIATEATVQREVTEEPTVQSEMEDSMLSLEPECTEITAAGATMKGMATEVPVKREVEHAVLPLESERTEALAAEAPMQTGVQDVPLNLESEYMGEVVNGPPLQSDTYPKELSVHGKGDEEEPRETKQTLLLTTTSSNDNQREETKFELMMEVEKDLFESGKLELASGDQLYSTQEILTVQLEDTGLPIPSIESSEAQKASLPVTAAAIEEQIIAETVTLMETSAETLEPLAAVPENLTSELVPDISIAHSGFGAAGGRSEEIAIVSVSEMTAAAVDGMTEAATSCTARDLVQKDDADDATHGKKQQKLECGEEAGERIVSQDKKSPSLTHIEFKKDIAQSVTIESQSTKIVLKIIQTAVDKLEKTEEPAAVCLASESQQQTESTERSQKAVNISEIQEGERADQQLPVKGEKTIVGTEQEFQQPSTVQHIGLTQSAEKQATLEQTENVPLISDISKDGEIQDSGESVAVPECVSSENLGAQRSAANVSVSEDVSKEIGTDQPKLKEKEAVGTQEKCMVQQTHKERKKDERSQSVEDVKIHRPEDVNNQEYTSCGSPQLKSELTKS
ncbi:A-kinase anchor protein 12 isoform X2 [Emydura macquarii macquarii]|uniref:A-kinase anchor protein 12 isoform X2 n=1 Tax=Emydura macquarii macquarii TaxID=1129001 RepID=UPI00352A1BBD